MRLIRDDAVVNHTNAVRLRIPLSHHQTLFNQGSEGTMRRNVARVDRNVGRGTVAPQHWQRRRMRPILVALEPRTLLSTWFVNSANGGMADGLTPDTGFTTIQAGIASASFGDTVLVETGNGYNESDTVDVPDLTIEADSGQNPVLDGSSPGFQGSPGFTITTFGVTISGFTIQEFSGPSAVLVQGFFDSLVLSNDLFVGNAANEGGAVFNSSGASLTAIGCRFDVNRAFSSGGAIANKGDMDLIDSSFSGNSAGGSGGAVSNSSAGLGSISGCNFSGNHNSGGGGGGISVHAGSLTIANSSIDNSFSSDQGGGLFILFGSANVSNCTFANDTAGGSGGGIETVGNLSVTSSNFINDFAGNSGGGINNDGAVFFGPMTSVSQCTFTGNTALNGGGGIANNGAMTISASTFSQNTAAFGGGLDNTSSVLKVFDSAFTGNSAGATGGGVLNANGNTGSFSGCTFSENHAGTTGGGGIAVIGGVLTIANSTIAGNISSSVGGGVLVLTGSSLTTINDTIAGNNASSGGGLDNAGATVTIGNTIVATNTATISGPDALGTFASQGNNLVGETDGSSGWITSDLTGTIAQPLSPLLAAPGDYGGPTQTLALLPGSPAIDAGSNALIPAGVTTDQRGLPRVVNAVVDIGAFESSGFAIAVTSGNGQSAGVLTAFPAPLVVTVTPKNPSEPVAGGLVTFTPPPSGASATLGGNPAPISASGTASVAATANGIVGSYSVSATARGVTVVASFGLTNEQLIIALDPLAPAALSLAGNASIKIPGIVYVDSSSSSALSASGNAQVKAASIDIHGGVKKSGNASLSPTPVTGAQVLSVASLPLPSAMGMSNGSLILSGNSSRTIGPGIYSQISVSGSAKLMMSSGIYIIEGGGFSVSSSASVTGSGVMIFNGGSKYPNTGGTYGAITLSGNATYNLTPATSGPYAGIVMFQPLDNTKAMIVSANATGITGTIYAPTAQLSETSTAALDTSLIFDTLTISGNGMVGPSTAAAAGTSGGLAATPGGTTTLTITTEPAAPLDQAAPNTIPVKMKIKIKLTDAAGNNVSSSSLSAVSMSVVGSDGNLVPQTAPGNSQRGNPFTFDPTTGTYRFKLKLEAEGSGRV